MLTPNRGHCRTLSKQKFCECKINDLLISCECWTCALDQKAREGLRNKEFPKCAEEVIGARYVLFSQLN